MKLIGSVMVIAASGLTGMAVAGSYARRPGELRALRSAFQMLETEIGYGATPLKEALSQVAARCDRTVAPLFGGVAGMLSESRGTTAAEAWLKSMERCYPETALKPQDLSILRDLGSSIGISGREDQMKHLRLAMERIGREITAAEEEAARNVKLWSYLGFLGGLMAVLVLY